MDMQGGRGSATATSTEVLDGLNDLLQLDHDAIGAYEIAIERLENRDHATQISGFKLDHQRHIRELNELIQELGGTPVNEPHATGPFKQAMQALGAMGGDRGILLAWRANELQVRTKYDGYASKAVFWPDNVKRVIDRNALDEERHYRWVADELQRMGIGAGEGMETDLANRMREKASAASARVRRLPDEARERVTSAMGSARERAAEGLDMAADRLDEMASRGASGDGARGRAANAAHRVADGMESTAEFVRSPDLERLRTDVEAQMRTSPLRTMAATFAVGFVIGRILR